MNIYDIVYASLVVGIYRLAIECHDIGLVNREIYILNATLSLNFVIELHSRAVSGSKCYFISHIDYSF